MGARADPRRREFLPRRNLDGDFAGRPSGVGVTATYSTAEGADLSSLLLPPDLRGGAKEGSFNVALSVSHLLVESPDQPGKGFGIYGKAAITDGNPNPIQSSFAGGFAGHGIVPNRPDDVFGIGYYFYNFSDDLQTTLVTALAFDDEQDIAATHWLHVVPDFQWIDPARSDFSDSWVASLRAIIYF